MKEYSTPQGKDPQLWQLAQRRASFKTHLATYIIINVFLWVLWMMGDDRSQQQGLPWPVWPTLGWGIGLAFHYLGAYVHPQHNNTEKEYEKLMNEKKNESSN